MQIDLHLSAIHTSHFHVGTSYWACSLFLIPYLGAWSANSKVPQCYCSYACFFFGINTHMIHSILNSIGMELSSLLTLPWAFPIPSYLSHIFGMVFPGVIIPSGLVMYYLFYWSCHRVPLLLRQCWHGASCQWCGVRWLACTCSTHCCTLIPLSLCTQLYPRKLIALPVLFCL